MPEPRQKTALITGALSGIGHATAIEFAKRGYKVFAAARRLEPMRDLENDHDVIIFKLDVLSLEDVRAAKDFLTQQADGYLDILFNNAGQSCTFPAIDVTDEWFTQCFEVNVFGPMRLVRELAPLLINAKGTIGFTGSVSGMVPFPFSCVYSSSKAAIHQYAATLRIEMKPFGVRVLNVVTGGVKTDIEDKRSLPQSSLFNVKGIDVAITERRQMAKKNLPIEASVYARQVADDFENSRAGLNVYRGAKAYFLGFLMYWAPRSLVEAVLIRKFKLIGVYEAIRLKYSKTKVA